MQLNYIWKLPEAASEKLKAISNKRNKKDVIENILGLYFKHIREVKYIASFKKAKDDHDIIELAESGFEDYLEEILKIHPTK